MEDTKVDTFVLYFPEIDQKSLPYVGGKGANLGEMTKAGFPVPPGFCVATSAFRAFLETSDQMEGFFNELNQVSADDIEPIRHLGGRIRDHLNQLVMPNEIAEAILRAWRHQGSEKSYAVRSSATAEDLPGASFAGQQETYLNVIGQNQVLVAIRRCWASLFTDRAIAYRAKNGFDHRQVWLAVVVQEMVFPDVSGIMFTADPVSGHRFITSIDASFGLGEALVSGLVSADLYQVRDNQITQKKISIKKMAIYAVPEGGTRTRDLTPEEQQAQALSDKQIIELARLGQKVEEHYGSEQDMEWALVHDRFYLVQSRPITSLYPVPEFPDNNLHVLVSLGHIQMMTDVMRPMATSIFSTLAPIAMEIGGRIYADFTKPFGLKALRKGMSRGLRNMDEQLGSALEELVTRPNIQFPSTRVPIRKVASIAFPIVSMIFHNVLFADPVSRRASVDHLIEESVRKCRQDVLGSDVSSRMDAIKQNMKHDLIPSALRVVPNFVTGEIIAAQIKKRLQAWLGDTESFYALGRSLPGNVTSELGLMIGDLADIARGNPRLLEYLQNATSDGFDQGLLGVADSDAFRLNLQAFMRQYGMRCPGEIDISKPRWRDTPTTLVPAILSHIRTMAPGEHRTKFEAADREVAILTRKLIDRVRKEKGLVHAKVMRRMIRVYRNLAGLREHHKYLLIQHFDIYRQAILELARTLVQAGVLDETTDVFYLTIDELQALEKRIDANDVPSLIATRKQQEQLNQKRTPPRVMTSEGEVITGRKRDVKAPDGALIGTPVSAGVVEGYAKIVLRPEEAQLHPGEIMIAPFTDPGWTPLFHSAKALVMEVGGLMTHGAVVAREYGIPSVVGIDCATQVIKDGAYIRVDGTHGYVEILQMP